MLDYKITTSRSIEILKAAKQLLIKKDWCQGHNAQRVSGLMTNCKDIRAYSFCIQGAMRAVSISDGDNPEYNFGVDQILTAITARLGIHPTTFNDQGGRTKQEVLDFLDKAIEAFEEEDKGN